MDTAYDAAGGKKARSKTRIIHILSGVRGTPQSTTGLFLFSLTTSHSRGELETILVRNDLNLRFSRRCPEITPARVFVGKPHNTPHFHLFLCFRYVTVCRNIQLTCVAVYTEINHRGELPSLAFDLGKFQVYLQLSTECLLL
jgi:hypothetical protein